MDVSFIRTIRVFVNILLLISHKTWKINEKYNNTGILLILNISFHRYLAKYFTNLY